ncbi:hypothetical protein SAMN05421505_12041 [Sinosporangium album]|uniref:Uncharacterized protein n=1 Tax=Sinosporangium album TaxID=504805 RepID=A0A1G8ECI5_9ACTN|nr:hypothetical protein [Sinosporangium album]SDH67655.1 hypothetical protein SAMN05421505_12041 [Sinosporangium album]
MTSTPRRTPTETELADARRSARLAATRGFPVGVNPYAADPEQALLSQVWTATYADTTPDGEV